MTAIEIQRIYLDEAKKRLAGLSDDADWTLVEWEWVLDKLESDPLSLTDCLDWVAKYTLLNEFREEEGLRWSPNRRAQRASLGGRAQRPNTVNFRWG